MIYIDTDKIASEVRKDANEVRKDASETRTLDYSLSTYEERLARVEWVLEGTPNPTPTHLEAMASYLLFEGNNYPSSKREVPHEDIAPIEHKIANDKTIIFKPRNSITKDDVLCIPYMRQLRNEIKTWEGIKETGRAAYIVKSALIEMRKEQYILKEAYRRPISIPPQHSARPPLTLPDDTYVDAAGELHVRGISLCDPNVCSVVLAHYPKAAPTLSSDFFFLLLSFDEFLERVLKDNPLYEKVVRMRLEGYSNQEVKDAVEAEGNPEHPLEYYCVIFSQKVPRLIARAAQQEFMTWHYEANHLPFKTCTKCGRTMPANRMFFSRGSNNRYNSFYSICKECRGHKRQSK